MKKITLSILFFCLGFLVFAQDYSLSGSYYCPKTKEALLIKFNKDKGYIEKIMYGKGAGKFANMQIMSQKGDVKALQYEIKFYNPASPNTVHHAVFGVSPGGFGFSVTTNKKPESMRDFGEIQNGDYEIEAAHMGVPYFVRNIYWRGFKNETNNATLIAEDSQEGTAAGQLYIKYTDPAGQEEYISAQVNPTTHELTFKSKNMGANVRCEIDNEMRWVIRVFNATKKQKIGDFYQIFK